MIRNRVSLLAGLACSLALASSRADTLWPLDDSRAALAARDHLIRGAQRTLDIAMYWWRDDRTGAEAAALVQEAARRGVRARIVIDAIRSELPESLIIALVDTPGIELRIFNPLEIHAPGNLGRRLHEKMLVADRKVMLIGGRNQVEKFYEHRSQAPYLDRDLLIRGSLAAEAAEHFERLWTHPMVREVSPAKTAKLRIPSFQPAFQTRNWKRRRGQQTLNEALLHLSQNGATSPSQRFEIPPGRLHLFFDPIMKDDTGSPWIPHLAKMMRTARREVWIESPWVVLTDSVRAMLREARSRGLTVSVVTNSLPACRDYMVYAAHEDSCRELADMGVKVWLMPGPASLHSKTVVIDQRFVDVGTFNLDPRSEFLNHESMVHVDDATFARSLLAVIESHRRQAHPFEHCEGLCLELRIPRPANLLKRAGIPLMRLLLPLYRDTL